MDDETGDRVRLQKIEKRTVTSLSHKNWRGESRRLSVLFPPSAGGGRGRSLPDGADHFEIDAGYLECEAQGDRPGILVLRGQVALGIRPRR